MAKGIPNKRHTGEFKQTAVGYMMKHKLSCTETGRTFATDHRNGARWEYIYLEDGAQGLYEERGAHKCCQRNEKRTFAKLPKQAVESIDYLDYCNNRWIQAKRKGLPPAIHRQQALAAASLNYLSHFLGLLFQLGKRRFIRNDRNIIVKL